MNKIIIIGLVLLTISISIFVIQRNYSAKKSSLQESGDECYVDSQNPYRATDCTVLSDKDLKCQNSDCFTNAWKECIKQTTACMDKLYACTGSDKGVWTNGIYTVNGIPQIQCMNDYKNCMDGTNYECGNAYTTQTQCENNVKNCVADPKKNKYDYHYYKTKDGNYILDSNKNWMTRYYST